MIVHRLLIAILLIAVSSSAPALAQKQQTGSADPPASAADPLRAMQSEAVANARAGWGYWGTQPDRYSTWTSHSNRMIPVYTFGITLDTLRGEGSVYGDRERLKTLYGRVPDGTHNPTATYFDQTDVYRLQQQAAEAGYRNIVLMVFDGMDWQTTRAAATYATGQVGYHSGRGSGLSFQDYRGSATDFGLIVTSPWLAGAKENVDAQTIEADQQDATGGFDVRRGGRAPWHEPTRSGYLTGRDPDQPHTVTDSAASATSMTTGIKTYNGSINVDVRGEQVEPIARRLQREQDKAIGIVTSVPVSHATPAAAYANNVSRGDYQDLTRDLLGLPSVAHRRQPLPGVDVLIGSGWGVEKDRDAGQGSNFQPGNAYLHEVDLDRSDRRHGGRYVVAKRQAGREGRAALMSAANQAADSGDRLLGFFGTDAGHLPYRTADGGFNPTEDVKGTERYEQADVEENPTLAEMTEAALGVLERDEDGFWLLIEAGDVDWANHANNIDSSVGAVQSGADAFDALTEWIERRDAWDETAVIVTSDHGHFFILDQPEQIAAAGRAAAKPDMSSAVGR